MISEETKKQILKEEIYRFEVQTELRLKEKRPKRLWVFLNSNFGIWLLSSVALGFITWGYAQISQSISEGKTNLLEIQKHDMEIAARIKNYKTSIFNLRQNADYFTTNDDLLSAGHDFVFPEYREKNLRAILLEQYLLVPDNKKEEINKAIIGVDKLSRLKSHKEQELKENGGKHL